MRQCAVQFPAMRFEVLGPLRIEREGEPVSVTSGRQRALLANLLIAGDEVVSAERLIEAVWGDDLPSNPANTLQHGVAQLRKLLEPERSRSNPARVLVSEGAGYRLNLDDHSTDMTEFQTAVDRGRDLLEQSQPGEATDGLTAAMALWRGPAYSDFAYADFARAESERLNELRIQCRELLIDATAAADGPETVIPTLEGLVVEFPYREGLWSRLMKSLYQTGRQAEALRVYREASRVLGDELGIDPSPELRQLEEQILLQDPALEQTKRRTTRHNLPAFTTSLVGREDALAQVLEYTTSARLTTLLGPGGSGKTRLAIEAAHRVVNDYPDGVWLVRLDDLTDTNLLAATIGDAVRMPENRDQAVVETLATHLADKRSLLVLDNCEHLIDAVAGLGDKLLDRCPSLVILATSQEPLHINGEQRFPVPPLQLPGDSGSPFDDINTVPAVQLFMERASAIDPGIDQSPTSVAAIANIVQALDGIPLAIELAAARTDVLTPTEIARRLADRFEILDNGPRDAPHRQRTLRNTVEWSAGLLDPIERSFFERLCVFAGCFDVTAAAAVTATSGTQALSLIGRLVQRSLITRSSAVAGESRYRLLESLRIFGMEQLAQSGELDATRDLHLNHYAERTLQYDIALAGAGQSVAFEGMVADQDNLRSAMGWSLESRCFSPGVMVAARAGRFWDWRGSLAEAVTWTDRFIDAVDDQTVPALAILVSWAGYFAWELGEAARAEDLIARAVNIATEQGDDYARAIALTGSALQARVGGEAADAVKIDGDIREVAQQIGDGWLAAWADNHDGLSLLGVGDLAGARAAGEASLRGFRDLGDNRATGWALTVLAQVAHDRADYPKVIELAEEAATLSSAAEDGRNAAWALELAAEAAAATGDEAAATRFAADAAELLNERGVPFSPWRRP